METLHAYQSLIKDNLDYDSLLVSHPHDKNQIDEIVDLIVETVMCKSDKVLIASNWYSGALVRGKFMKLDYSHVEYVLHCLEGNTSKIKNIKKYLLVEQNAGYSVGGVNVKKHAYIVKIKNKKYYTAHGCFFLSLGKRKVGKEISVFKNEKYGNEVFKCFDFRIEVVALLVFLFGVFIIYSGLR